MQELKLEVKKLGTRDTKGCAGCAPVCPVSGGAGLVWDGICLDFSISLCA